MTRTLVGAAIGMVVGMLGLAVWGAYYGYVHGVSSAKLPPGMDAALLDAFVFMMYFFWAALPVGAVIGGAAGFASWLVRPAKRRRAG